MCYVQKLHIVNIPYKNVFININSQEKAGEISLFFFNFKFLQNVENKLII